MASSLQNNFANNYGNYEKNVYFGQTQVFPPSLYCPRLTKQTPNDAVTLQNRQKKQGMSSKTKWAIGIGLATVAAGIIYCVAKGKFSKAKQLAEHIDFNPAKTIEEAKEFAMKNLGVKQYDIDQLNMANFVNEGLVNASNRCKGKGFWPDVITWGDDMLGNNTLMGACNYKGKNYLYINNKYYENIDKHIAENINLLRLKAEQVNINGKNSVKINGPAISLAVLLSNKENAGFSSMLVKYITNKQISFNEKIHLDTGLRSFVDILLSIKENPREFYSHFLSNPKSLEIIKKNGLPTTVEELMKEEPILNTIDALLRKINFDMWPKIHLPMVSPFSSIYHELGHLQRKNTLPEKYISSMLRPNSPTETVGKLTKEFLENADKQRIAGTVSAYAKYAPEEFCAEVYSVLMNNRPISDEVMKLYKFYGGLAIG